jgi:GNAT superfamily N-acetyltransferase
MSNSELNALSFRRARRDDMDWVYQTFRTTMKSYIEKTWGWDELFQRHGFAENLPSSSFTIASLNGETVGAYSLLEKDSHLRLEMLLILPERQNQGIGSRVLRSVQTQAALKRKPLRLNVLKINPAANFYLRMGFQTSGEDAWSYQLLWIDPHPQD